MKFSVLVIPLAVGLAAPAAARTAPATAHPPSAMKFADKSAITDRFEIRAGKLAEQKSGNDKVRNYGKMIVHDHQKALDQLTKTVKGLNDVSLPDGVDEAHASMLQQLKNASGKQFDKTFKLQQVEGHKQAILLTKAYAQSGKNDQLKKLAQKSLPVLEKHLAHAKELPPSSQHLKGKMQTATPGSATKKTK